MAIKTVGKSGYISPSGEMHPFDEIVAETQVELDELVSIGTILDYTGTYIPSRQNFYLGVMMAYTSKDGDDRIAFASFDFAVNSMLTGIDIQATTVHEGTFCFECGYFSGILTVALECCKSTLERKHGFKWK